MNKFFYPDLLLNVVAPLFIGVFFYFDLFKMPSIILNHLADGLWAYALVSALLIIWDRKPSFFWICSAIFLGAAFEYLQYVTFLPGTGDFFDLLIYLLFATFALVLNNKIRPHYLKSNLKKHEPTP